MLERKINFSNLETRIENIKVINQIFSDKIHFKNDTTMLKSNFFFNQNKSHEYANEINICNVFYSGNS